MDVLVEWLTGFMGGQIGGFSGLDGQDRQEFEARCRAETFDHRSGDPYNEHTYDDLDRLTDADYLVDGGTPDREDSFVMDGLGNRTGDQTLSDETVNFTVQSSTNRYTSIGGTDVSHDDAGNMNEHTRNGTKYHYDYDYENRVVLIKKETAPDTWAPVAEYDYDALGRRIRLQKDFVDSVPSVVTLFYYNPDWQCLAEYNGADTLQRYFIYGNYIDEPLVINDGTDDFYYVQDHLYSTVALIGYIDSAWAVAERYEYDAYGTVLVYADDGGDGDWFDGDETTGVVSAIGNPYTFTGRRLDVLDGDGLLRMHYRHRDYDVYAGRFLQHDPLGSIDGINLYEYVRSQATGATDPYGLLFHGDVPVTDGGSTPGAKQPPRLEAKGSFKCCESGRLAIDIVNKALQIGACKEWFESHGADGDKFRVRVRPNWKGACLVGAFMYTWPFTNDIAICKRSCDHDAALNAALLIHELAHHFVGVSPGREDRANEAMEACEAALSIAAK